jgi:hypothetical protein
MLIDASKTLEKKLGREAVRRSGFQMFLLL